MGTLAIACWVWLGAPATLEAEGTQTGIMSGIVVGPDGNALAAAEVQLRGTRTQRATSTDDQGRSRFPGLEVGPYTLDAALLDLQTSLSEVWIHIDQTTEGTVELAPEGEQIPVATIEESLQVVALAPLIDRYDTSVSTRVSYAFLDKLPAERLYQSVAQLLPGVAGNDPGNPNVSGALRGSNLYLVDGIDTTDSTTGLFGLNLGYDSVEEVEVTTAGLPVDYGRVSGAVINVVTQSRRDRFSGRLRWLARSPDWTDDFEDDAAHLQSELAAANRGGSDLDNTISITAGGPLVPKRLWFTTGFEHEEGTFLRPTLTSQIWDEGTEIENAAFKVDACLTNRQSLTAQVLIDEATFTTFPQPFEIAAGENRAGQAPAQLMGSFVEPLPGDLLALSNRAQEGDFARIRWLGALSSFGSGRSARPRRCSSTTLCKLGAGSSASACAPSRCAPKTIAARAWSRTPRSPPDSRSSSTPMVTARFSCRPAGHG